VLRPAFALAHEVAPGGTFCPLRVAKKRQADTTRLARKVTKMALLVWLCMGANEESSV
jgi:hypothetical protein